MTELTMPRLSDSMEQGTILTWLKVDGEQVEAGEDLLAIETDKATVTHVAEAGGVLQIIALEGTTLPVGAPIARIGAALAAPPGPQANGAQSAATSTTPSHAAGDRAGMTAREPVAAPAGNSAGVAAGEVGGIARRATPLARRVAHAHCVSLEDVVGSGPLGRITRGDVLAKVGIAPSPPTATPSAVTTIGPPPATEPPATSGKGTVDVVEPTRLQTVIARRMAEAKATIPHFQVQTEVEMDAVVAFRAQLKDVGGTSPSLNDLIVKAAALALRRHPVANGSYRDGRFELHSRINVGIAVAAHDALVVPTIFDADQKSLREIAADSRRLAGRVRDSAVSPAKLAGATFTVSNLGMYRMTAITPVVNPPQAAILGVGAIREVLARVDGEIIDRRVMTLTLSCDHRILYGAEAAGFLLDVRALLEAPLNMVL
jgi:pyruvate dehydrogenase E2 component (dihydrolipoamide acetyltransferase)